jgi:oligopeptide transport system substrate-binding protein
MNKKRITSLVITSIMLLSLSMTGCGNSKAAVAPAKEQVLNAYIEGDAVTLDSVKASDDATITVFNDAQEGLVRYVDDGKLTKIEPAGAEKWDVSSDGLVWTFHLRDYKWSDGKAVTANDYVYSWLRLLDKNVAAPYSYFLFGVKGAEAYNKGEAKAEDVGIKAVDAKTFQVTLTVPAPYFPELTGFRPLVPQRKDNVEAEGDKFGQDPSKVLYSGPFIIKEWTKGSKVTLVKNPQYWDASNVKLDKLIFNIVKEKATQAQMFEGKQLDYIVPEGEYLDKYKKETEQGKYTNVTKVFPKTAYIFFNNKDANKLFSNQKIRTAFALAYDREELAKNVYQGWTAAYGYVPFAMTSGKTEYRSAVPEPLKALKDTDAKNLFKEGLKEAGLNPDGNYEIDLAASGSNALNRTAAEWYQNQWQTKLGVKVKIDLVDSTSQLTSLTQTGKYQIGMLQWGADFNDPINFLDMFTTGNANNLASFGDPKYDEIVKKVYLETDPAKRIEMYKQLEQMLLVDDCAISPSVYQNKALFVQTNVKGVMIPLFGCSYEFKYASVEK